MDSFEEAFSVAVTDALTNHSNTLDLRVPLQCKFWIEELPDQVQRFISLGGYRMYPDFIRVEQNDNKISLLHSWKNYGVGVFPNKHPNWNYKYKVSFALLDNRDQVVFHYTEKEAEPSNWLKGGTYNYVTVLDTPKELEGCYTLCVGITDSMKNNEPSIDLAVSKDQKKGKWVKITDLQL